jgi:hypothetical protein
MDVEHGRAGVVAMDTEGECRQCSLGCEPFNAAMTKRSAKYSGTRPERGLQFSGSEDVWIRVARSKPAFPCKDLGLQS